MTIPLKLTAGKTPSLVQLPETITTPKDIVMAIRHYLTQGSTVSADKALSILNNHLTRLEQGKEVTLEQIASEITPDSERSVFMGTEPVGYTEDDELLFDEDDDFAHVDPTVRRYFGPAPTAGDASLPDTRPKTMIQNRLDGLTVDPKKKSAIKDFIDTLSDQDAVDLFSEVMPRRSPNFVEILSQKAMAAEGGTGVAKNPLNNGE